MDRRQSAGRQDQSAVWSARELCDSALDVVGIAHAACAHADPKRRRHRLDDGELPDPGREDRIPKNRGPPYLWRNLLKEFEPLAAQRVFELHKARGVSARDGYAINVASADGGGDL